MALVTFVHGVAQRVTARLARSAAGHTMPPVHNEASLAHAYATGWHDYRCGFVLSTGRVGTATLQALLALSPALQATHEPSPVLVKASFDAWKSGDDVGGATWRALVLAARDECVVASRRRGTTYVETNNRMTYLAPALSAAFPASQFIHLHRHPYGVIHSAMRRGYFANHGWDFARITPRSDDPVHNEWGTLSAFEKNAWYWAKVNELAMAHTARLSEQRVLTCGSDELFSGNADLMRTLFAFFGVDVPAQSAIRSVLGQQLNAERQGEFPAPASWTREDRQRVWKHAGPLAERLGYRP